MCVFYRQTGELVTQTPKKEKEKEEFSTAGLQLQELQKHHKQELQEQYYNTKATTIPTHNLSVVYSRGWYQQHSAHAVQHLSTDTGEIHTTQYNIVLHSTTQSN